MPSSARTPSLEVKIKLSRQAMPLDPMPRRRMHGHDARGGALHGFGQFIREIYKIGCHDDSSMLLAGAWRHRKKE